MSGDHSVCLQFPQWPQKPFSQTVPVEGPHDQEVNQAGGHLATGAFTDAGVIHVVSLPLREH